jgi:hypothetical protein
MTTDTAVGVTKRVVVDRGSLLPHLFSRNDRRLIVLRGGGLLVPLEEIPYVVRLVSLVLMLMAGGGC